MRSTIAAAALLLLWRAWAGSDWQAAIGESSLALPGEPLHVQLCST